ncbi:hypothetical protein [Brevibacillus choshinensis]|uniref:hypothetical protein n=1 Tax=Brevibacillus choshinensis TaxID=54911 RepID=UPI002E1C4743|nr:hypothetical protein [Brevibacillus choshinensis]
MIELLTLEQFREYKAIGKGFVAITDKNLSKNCVHDTSCNFVKERYFSQKVIESGRKNGSYYQTDDYNEAFERFEKMQRCQFCLP